MSPAIRFGADCAKGTEMPLILTAPFVRNSCEVRKLTDFAQLGTGAVWLIEACRPFVEKFCIKTEYEP